MQYTMQYYHSNIELKHIQSQYCALQSAIQVPSLDILNIFGINIIISLLGILILVA